MRWNEVPVGRVESFSPTDCAGIDRCSSALKGSTRETVKVDLEACPWRISKFVDPDAARDEFPGEPGVPSGEDCF